MLGWNAGVAVNKPVSRRNLLLSAVSTALGLSVPFYRAFPDGLIPAAFAVEGLLPADKSPLLRVLNDRPLNAETPAHLLDGEVTPGALMFIRNNGLPPNTTDAASWQLTIDGESVRQIARLSLTELKRRFPHHTYGLTLECGGNGRAEFRPAASGNQWTTGAVACGDWTGIRVRELLDWVGIREDAVYLAYHSADQHLTQDPTKEPISRGIPIAKAMEDETLLAFALNGEPIPPIHGAPLRLVAGGWPASASGKWVNRLSVRDRVHDGAKMGGKSYRVPCTPVAPGEVPKAMCIIESMPVKSLITAPKSGVVHSIDTPLAFRGHAWAGDQAVAEVFYSIDFGQTWRPAELSPPRNRLAWQRFKGEVDFPEPGYYELWARAVDDQGISQPIVVPGWNPKGYLNNACHRIAVRVTRA